MYAALSGLRQAVGLVDSLTELDDPSRFAELALPGLAQLVGCDSLSFNEIGPEPGLVSVISYPDAASPASVAGFAAYVREHPLVNHYLATGDDQPGIDASTDMVAVARAGIQADLAGKVSFWLSGVAGRAIQPSVQGLPFPGVSEAAAGSGTVCGGRVR